MITIILGIRAAIKDVNAGAYDLIDTSGAYVDWREVLAVYAVKTVTNPANDADVASMDDIKPAILRGVFWDMNNTTYSLETVNVEEDELDADGLPTGAMVSVSKTILRISVTHRTLNEAAALYDFSGEQREMLSELLKPDYYDLWNALLYGITSIGGAPNEILKMRVATVTATLTLFDISAVFNHADFKIGASLVVVGVCP